MNRTVLIWIFYSVDEKLFLWRRPFVHSPEFIFYHLYAHMCKIIHINGCHDFNGISCVAAVTQWLKVLSLPKRGRNITPFPVNKNFRKLRLVLNFNSIIRDSLESHNISKLNSHKIKTVLNWKKNSRKILKKIIQLFPIFEKFPSGEKTKPQIENRKK